MFFPGRDNPSLNMMNASFTEEDTLCGKGLCISTGKYVLCVRGGVGGMTSCGSWLFARALGAFWAPSGAKPASSQREGGEGPAHPSCVWSSPPPSWGHPASAFLFRDLIFWLRDLGPDWRSHSWDQTLSLTMFLL